MAALPNGGTRPLILPEHSSPIGLQYATADSFSVHMIEREVTVRNRAGLHTRPASMIVRTASQFDSEIFLRRDNYEINGKSVIGVMTLAAEQGATLTVVVDGEDEEEAADALAELFADGFGEELE